MTLVQAAVVGSVILMDRRQSTELSPQQLKILWNEWQLRTLILLSLTSQIILVILGNRRKYITKTWVRAIVWFFYLLADSVAIMAIGVLSNNIGKVYWEGNLKSRSPDYELKAFWAPFLLLHMGGMDTITAHSLEDNELWLRHSFGVITQAVTTAYILLILWSTSSRLSPLSIVVFFVGLNKYCERVWALFSASEKRFRDSIPHIPTRESRIMEECKLKLLEGYHVSEHQVLEVEVPGVDESVPDSDDAREILLAYSFFEMVKRLFADLILGFQDRDESRAIFENKDGMDGYKALKVIEIELGLMYDVRYTKATVVYSSWGITQRIIGSFLILFVLVMVLQDEALVGKNCPKIDLTITLVLLVVALLLDLFAFGELLLSDQTAHWLIKLNKATLLQTINQIRTMIPTNWGRKRKRWSKTVEQFSLLSFCFATRKQPLFCLKILKLLRVEEVAEIFWYKSITPPYSLTLFRDLGEDGDKDLPEYIFDKVKEDRSWAEKNGNGTDDLKFLYGRRGVFALERHNCSGLEWSVKIEFEQCVLVWHLATEICYQLNNWGEPYVGNLYAILQDRGKCISRYMLYLLVQHPNMLPVGMGQIKFRDLYSDLADFIETHVSKSLKVTTEKEASQRLLDMVKDENMLVGGGDNSYYVIFHGCKLASQLRKYEDEEQKWTVIIHVWIEILCHAASQCKGRQHAQQLRRGGEFLTHLWLLMAHFGLTDHFQIHRSRPIAEAALR